MDIMKLFEEYLPKWSEENMQPIPTMEHPDRWAIAWRDFQNTYLKEHHKEIVEFYKNMQFKTVGDLEREQEEEVEEEEPVVEEKEESEWDRVRKFLQ